MKKAIYLILFSTCITIFCNGCLSGYHIGDGFPRTLPGSIAANQKSGGYIAPKMESMKDVEMLGRVSSELEARQILMIISLGDISIATAKQQALQKYPQADDIVNIEIDVRHESLLGLYNTVTMYFNGIAIKYKK
ncbi:MAG: hypothetical protein IKA22_03885 [Lentisphaeria bacterium]|nr:hypothetical protein [Alphaproteobacteria bacterium]MBR1965729.1 hypothetical protein [Lentisphaeria bacterium]